MPIGSVDWIEDGMLQGDLRELGNNHYQFDVRNQFFHGAHPIGWIRDIEVTMNGIAADDVAFTVRGQRVPLDLVRSTSDIWWYPLEVANVSFALPETPEPADDADITCRFAVSTFFFTPAIDRDDRYPTMSLPLRRRLPITAEVNA